jgi:hypothetical protein
MRIVKLERLLATALVVSGLTFASHAHAVDACKVKLDPKTGVIQFSGKNVLGVLRWGDSVSSASNVFANNATCVSSGKATKCELGLPGTADRITPPELCTLFVRDIGGGPSCSAFIKGCTPGVRPGSAAASVPGGAKAGVVAVCSAIANDVKILRSFNNVNASAITIDDGTLAGRCEITFPFSLANRYFSVEPVSAISTTTTFKIDYEIDGNTIRILTQQYLPPVWAGLGLQVSVLVF